MRKYILLLTILTLTAWQGKAQSMQGYEYWFDDDYTARTAVTSSQPDVSFEADYSSLQAGLHYLNFRAQGSDGQWGALSRMLVYLTADSRGSADMVAYEYWMDSDYSSRTSVAGSGVQAFTVDVGDLQAGLHYLNFRAQGSDGQWGALSRMLVYLTADSRGSADMVAYEYWMDSDYTNRTAVSGSTVDSPITLDISNLQFGLHYFNFRAQGSDGQWGTLSRYIVYLSDAPSINKLANIAYWIDDNTNGKQYQQVNDSIIVISTDISNLSVGYHTFNIEGRTQKGGYSGLLASYEFVKGEISGEATFDGLVATISGERTLDEAFNSAGGRSEAAKTIAAIVWGADASLTQSDLQGLDNPNLLIFVDNASKVASLDRDNIVINGLAKNIRLTDQKEGNNNFYAPQAFTAEMISYTRDFQQETQVDVSRGWESIALPFDVQTIFHEKQGVIAPFGVDSSNKHFWLRTLSPNGLVRATKIEANTPYIISMPNDAVKYPEEFLLAGRVTFSAENATVPVTEVKTLAYADSSIVMRPTMQSVGVSSDVWALNVGQVRSKYLEGSVFERDYRVVRPFEAYTVHKNRASSEDDNPSPRMIPVRMLMGQDATGIVSIDNGQLTMDNEKWLTLDGRRLQQKPSKKGVYIKNGKKIVLK